MTEEWGIIYSYSREQALADRVLVDVSKMAKEAGIKYPTAVTAAVWSIIERLPEGHEQSVEGRLWDTLWMFRLAAQKQNGQEVHFSVLYAMDNGTDEVKMWGWCGPGDTEDPVITLMLEGED
jgi:hypothetical protein